MRITDSLMMWVQGELQRRRLSYREFSKIAGVSHQNISRLATGAVSECEAAMEDALCRGFGVTKEQLRLIAEGATPVQCASYDIECEKARAIWRWIAYDANRIAAIRAMGFDGELPEPMKSKPKATP